MKFISTTLNDVYIIDHEMISDSRGFFARSWCKKEFEQNQLRTNLVQCNTSFNIKAGTIRGLHYQASPHEETKIVRCIRGSIYDVVIDLRSQSSTYMNWIGVHLNAENRRMLYIPEGFAHGYQTLTENTEIYYQVDQYYHPASERGIRWNDPNFDIDWPLRDHYIISEKDELWPDFS